MAANSSENGDVQTMDAEHRVQLGLFKALEDALANSGEAEEVESILEQLVEYTNVHFLSEQLMMRLYDYPHYQAHTREHDELMDRIRDLQRHYQEGQEQEVVELAISVKSWLTGHMHRSDQALHEFLENLKESDPNVAAVSAVTQN